jgi:uncharacterized protein YjbI with pentapeptide repeats
VARKNSLSNSKHDGAAIRVPEIDHGVLTAAVSARPSEGAYYERATLDQADWHDLVATGLVFDTCSITRLAVDGGTLSNLRLIDVLIAKSSLCNCNFRKATLRRVEVVGSRLTGLAVSDAQLRDVHIRNCKAEFIRFSSTTLKDMRFENCMMAEADFDGATLENVIFANCNLRSLGLSNSTLHNVDPERLGD